MRIIALLICLSLPACLVTPRPVFDAASSVPAAESPAFMAFVEAWEAWAGDSDSPREMIGEGARVVELAGEPGGQALVQELTETGASYYLLGRMGARPVACVPNDTGIRALAAEHGVSVRIEPHDGQSGLPPTVHADGPDEALRAFIRAAHSALQLACTSPARGG